MELSKDEVGRSSLIFMLIILFCMMIGLSSANVVLIGRNVSLSVEDAEANFAPLIKGSGECGILYAAEPLDACSPLTNKVVEGGKSPPYVLVIRGGCTFDDKVRKAQLAGFKAVIVYDNEDSGALVSMAGTSTGIHIHAVFVTKASGETLMKYTGRSDVETWIIPTFENSVWSIMAISFISLLAMAAVLATCFFVRRHRIRREPRNPNMREFHGMRPELVRAMPALIFTSVMDESCTSMTCAICLEDYNVGEQLRVLPCRHKFHASCVDNWLTTWRSFCPVCKQDAKAGLVNCPATEHTPLLSSGSGAASPALSAALSSFHSSVASSPAIQIAPRPPRSQLNSRPHSLSGTPQIRRSNPDSNSPAIHVSRSSIDLRNASSPLHRFGSQIASPHSFGFHMPSPTRYGSPYIHSSSIGSPSYLAASSSQRSYLRRCNDSRDSLSGLASAQSLPGC